MKRPVQFRNSDEFVPCVRCGPNHMGWTGKRCAICGNLLERDAALVLINQLAMHEYANMTKGTVN